MTFAENQFVLIGYWFTRYSRAGIIEYIANVNSISGSCYVYLGWIIGSIVLAIMR